MVITEGHTAPQIDTDKRLQIPDSKFLTENFEPSDGTSPAEQEKISNEGNGGWENFAGWCLSGWHTSSRVSDAGLLLVASAMPRQTLC